MLKAEQFVLRTVTENDLPAMLTHLNNLENKGDYYPRSLRSEVRLRKLFEEDGMWAQNEGVLLIVDDNDAILGHIEFFQPVHYLNAYEISYLIYDVAARGKGIATEALAVLVRFLFDTKLINRIQLIIHPDNAASRRVADKCGFVHEATLRGAWFNYGTHHDVEVYSVLRHEIFGDSAE